MSRSERSRDASASRPVRPTATSRIARACSRRSRPRRARALARRMIAAVAAVGAGSDGAPVDRFRATGRAYIEFALDEPGLFEVAFRACPPDLYVPDDPSPYALLSEALDTLDHAGLLAVKRPGAETAAWVAVHGAAVLLGDGMLPHTDRDAIIDATLDMVGGGLLVATVHA